MLILSLFIIAMASVSASDVSDINDNHNGLSTNEDSVSGGELNKNLDLSSANADSSLDAIKKDSSSDSVVASSSGSSDSVVASSSGSSDSVVASSSGSSDSAVASSSEAADSIISANSESEISKMISSSNGSSSAILSKANSKLSNEPTKKTTVIEKSSSKVVYGSAYSVTLKDKNGNVLSGKHIIFTFNGNNYTKTTNSKGVASLKINEKAGKYTIAVSFIGDDSYEGSSISNKVTVSKASTNISSATKYAVRKKSYSIALKDQYGKAVAKRKVTIKFNGKTYNRTTNSKGIVSIKIYGQVTNTYKLSFKFAGDECYLASSGSESLKIRMGTYFKASDARLVKGRIYRVTLKDSNYKVLSKKTVKIIFNGKTYKKKTNAKGIVSLKLNAPPKKTYLITYKYAGSSYYGPTTKKVSIYIKTPTKLINSGSSVGRGKYYYIYLKDYKNNPLSKKTISIRYGTKTYKRTTNAKGRAALKISSAIGRIAKVTYRYAGNKYYGASSGTLNVKTKMATTVKGAASPIFIKGNTYKVTLRDGNKKVLPNRYITFTFNGKTFKKKTNAKGVASLKINAAAGKTYKFSYKYGGSSYYNRSSSGTIKLAVKIKTTIKKSAKYVVNGSSFVVCLKDSNGKALSGKKVNFVYNGNTFINTTDSSGNAHLRIVENQPKYSTMKFSFNGDKKYDASSGSLKLEVKSDKVFTFKQIVATAKTLRTYVKKNSKIPATVSVNGVKVNTTVFAYLMAKAITNLNKGKTPDVWVVQVSPTYKNSGNSSIKANLYKSGYINLTNRLITFVNEKKRLPYYLATNVGRLSPNLYIFSLSKALDFYSTDSYLPNYLILDTSDVDGKPAPTKRGNANQYKKGLNEVQSLSSSQLSKYLTASGNDATNQAIKTLANKLVSGKSTTWAKAQAIFNYVRDNVKYEYYSDTKYKAAGTLSNKRGNCCDHANLIVALCRAAKIPARYSHAQGCRFSSGLVAGHVWAQIYVDGVWYTADATSSRNSLGNIQNWNTNSYSSLKQYIHLPF